MTPATFVALAAACAPNIHPQTLHAVVKQESNYNALAIGINKAARLKSQPKTRDEAIAIANHLINEKVNFDAGLAQININNLNWLSMSVDDLFDPCKNLKASSLVLSACYQRASLQYGKGQQALRAALSCYNTGNFDRGFTNGYVRNVVAQAQTYVPAISVKLDTTTDATPVSEEAPPATVPRGGDVFSKHVEDVFAKTPKSK